MNRETEGTEFEFSQPINQEPVNRDIVDVDSRLSRMLSQNWDEHLGSENYEESAQALDEVKALREWRNRSRASDFSSFYRLFESAGTINQSAASPEESVLLKQSLADRLMSQSQGLTPRVADIYKAILSEMDGSGYSPQFEETQQKIAELREAGDLNLLLDGNVPFAVKANRIQTRLEGDLLGRRALDRRDRRKNDETREPVDQPSTPPPAQDESKPGMDEMERSAEGETPPAIWTITPAYGGYFRQQSFDLWDRQSNKWRQSSYDYSAVEESYHNFDEINEANGSIKHISTELPAGQWTRLPLPYGHSLHMQDLPCEVKIDQNGDFIVYSQTGGLVTFDIIGIESSRPNVTPDQILQFAPQLSEETLVRLREIVATKKGNLAKAMVAAGWTLRRLNYSNDSSFNQVYDSHPAGYIAAIDEHRQADCDVANTYFASLCSTLGIPVRHVVGHMVKGKDDEGNSRITSGTGHAWSEVWDETQSEWTRIDATPSGDPQLDEQQEESSEVVPGDYGEQEAVGPSDEYLAELEEKLSELTEKLSYSDEERQLAEAAGVELSEARQIVKEIAEAEDTRLPNGQRVVDLLSQLFSLIVEARRTATPDYTGPLRKREGGEEIDDIVAHKIGTKAGEIDPRSRQKPFERQTVEQVFGGFDLYLIGDKSGSMSQTVDGEAKWKIQRRAEYLIFSALNRFDQNIQRANLRSDHALSVRSQGISFRNSNEIDEDRPLSNTFTASDKVKLWRSLGNQGSENGDVAALSHVLGQIETERAEIEEQQKVDDRLRIVISCSDGYPDNPPAVQNLAGQLGQLNAVVVGLGLTETAAAVPAIFATETSRGEVVKDINHLPAVVAKNVILEATRLFPEKSKKSVDRIVASILDKFNLIN